MPMRRKPASPWDAPWPDEISLWMTRTSFHNFFFTLLILRAGSGFYPAGISSQKFTPSDFSIMADRALPSRLPTPFDYPLEDKKDRTYAPVFFAVQRGTGQSMTPRIPVRHDGTTRPESGIIAVKEAIISVLGPDDPQAEPAARRRTER